MKRKILCTILVISCILGAPKYAFATSDTSDCIDAPVPQNEVERLEQGIAASENYGRSYSALGIYEDNDTIATAFPYADTSRIEHQTNGLYGHYNCNFTYTFLETEDDIDYFKMTAKPGTYYAVVLKNVYLDQVRDIKLYYQKSDGSWWYKYANNKKERQTIFHFTADVNTYYIQISGEPSSGKKHSYAANWFAVEPDGTIDERPLVDSPYPACSLH